MCRVWCDVCCVGGRKGRRGEESKPSLTQKQTHPTPFQKRKESQLDFPAVLCYPHCAASCDCIIVLLWHKHGCWFFQQRFFLVVAGLVCFLARSTIPTLSQLVTSSQHFVKNTHCVLGTHCQMPFLRTKNSTVLRLVVEQCWTHRSFYVHCILEHWLATTLTRPEIHKSIAPEEDNSQHVAVHPAGPRRFHVVLFARE